jgi:hypothetical protein
MKGNIGRTDQLVRGLIGTALILLAGAGIVTGALQVIVVVAGSIAIVTATAGFCPLYRITGVTTYQA